MITQTTAEIFAVLGSILAVIGVCNFLSTLPDRSEVAADHALALAINAECYGQEPLFDGQRYSRTTFKENGRPILLNADGKRSVFCDLCDNMGDPI